MPNLLNRITSKLPTVHLAAASICVVITAATLTFLPSESVESATQQRIELPLATSTPATVSQQTLLPATSSADKKPEVSQANQSEVKANAVQPEPQIAAPIPTEPENWVEYKVTNGDNLTSLFKRAGLTPTDVYYVAQATKHNKVFARLKPGQSVSFLIEGGELKKLRYSKNRLESALITKTENGYDTQILTREPEIELRFASGTIENSLFLDAENAGMSSRMIMNMAAVFGWDIDFTLDLRKGDSFRVLYEDKYLDGEKIGEGNVLAAEFVNRGETFTAIRFTDQEGNSSYFSPDGNSMEKSFLRNPIDFARVSSRFNLKRRHPVLNKIRAHKGTDYAARTGTPIKSTGAGKITFRGKKGGYGNVVIVRHGNGATTLYAHMSKFKRGHKVGSRVRQGEVIGYVGKSGLATGPHLHYEYRINGVHKNPQTVKFPAAAPVAKGERAAFAEIATQMLSKLESRSATQVARNERATTTVIQ